MSKVHSVRLSQAMSVPQERAWNAIVDHPKMGDWLTEIDHVEMLAEGSPPNGLGATRKMVMKGAVPAIVEEVVHWDAPQLYHYEIREGVPGLKSHAGKMRVDALTPDSCVVHWHIDMAFSSFHPINLLASFVMGSLEKSGRTGLERLKEILEAE